MLIKSWIGLLNNTKIVLRVEKKQKRNLTTISKIKSLLMLILKSLMPLDRQELNYLQRRKLTISMPWDRYKSHWKSSISSKLVVPHSLRCLKSHWKWYLMLWNWNRHILWVRFQESLLKCLLKMEGILRFSKNWNKC
jgi:hypothetical protein